MAASVIAVIPARLHSRRFPKKVMYPFRNKPLLFHVYDEVRKARTIDRVIVATDSREIIEAVRSYGGEVVRTSVRHQTGSDRVAEAARKIGGKIIINVQADNFGLKASVLDRVVSAMRKASAIQYATLIRKLTSDDELFDPNIVKVLVNRDNSARWFSRFPLPYLQNARESERVRQFPFWGHIGIYFFRRAALEQFARWRRTPYEKAESLEQLRILEHGGEIRVFKTTMRSVSIDTPEDVKKLASIYTRNSHV